MNISEIKNSILNEINKQRQNAINQAEQNKHLAYENQEYLNLANELGGLKIDLAKARINGLKEEKILVQMDSVNKKMTLLLKEMGFADSDLTPQFDCKICKDEGRLSNGEYCNCFKQRLAKKLNDINGVLEDIEFKDCDKQPENLMEKLEKICISFPNLKFNKIILSGASGVGKTRIAQAITNYFIKKDFVALFISSARLNQDFLNYHLASIEEKQSIFEPLLTSDLLIVDDIGAEPKLKNVTNEYLLYLINSRNQKDKLTIFTTNLTPEAILNIYDERIFSRMFDKSKSIPILISGQDKRINV